MESQGELMETKKIRDGKWQCRVYDKYKKKKINFTGRTKQEAETKANQYIYTMGDNGSDMCFKKALELYIGSRESILSPTTLSVYKAYQNMYYDEINDKKLNDIKDFELQVLVDKISNGHAPKTVKNIFGLISAVYATYCPNRRIKVSLPKRVRPKIEIPSEADVKRIMRLSKGTELEIPVLLAVFCTMRRGEIAALDMDHIDFIKGTIHVEYSMVCDENKNLILKSPKSYAGNRFISCPREILDIIKEKGLPGLSPMSITNRFYKMQKRAKGKAYRFHDLRHYSASMKHELGIANVEIMRQGGWESEKILNEIYRHSISEEAEKADRIWSAYCGSVVKNWHKIGTECQQTLDSTMRITGLETDLAVEPEQP